MKNFNKLLIVLISLVFISSGIIAQSDVSPKLKNQLEVKAKPTKTTVAGNVIDMSGSSGLAPNSAQLIEQRLLTMGPVNSTNNGNYDSTDDFCAPTYTYGCSDGDGFTDFAVEEIQNLGSGCADLNGMGWSQYFGLGPATLVPGFTHTFSMSTGYANQYVNIWIDYNDDDILTANEIILQDYYLTSPGILYDVDVTIPANATPGLHAMRAMDVYSSTFTDPCGSYSFGEAEDYMVNIITPDYGTLEGYVTVNTGGAAIDGALVSVNGGMFTATTAANGYYQITDVLIGDWPVSCTKTGFNPASANITITVGGTTTQDFAMLAPTMDITPLVIDVTIDPFATSSEIITIANNGDGTLNWGASIINNTGDNAQGISNLVIEKGLSFLDPTSTAYAYNAYDPSGANPEGPIYFTLDSPGVVTAFGTAASDFVAAADWVDDVWYGCVYGGTFITIDMTTGLPTVIGPCPDLSGMAYDWTQGIMYGVDFAGGLYTIDLATGAGTMVATTQGGLITMVCDNDGILYGFDLNTDNFGSIDKSTGAWTVIANVGFDFIYAQDASVDHETNTIYWAAYTTLGQLYTIDQTTGIPTLIGDFPGGMEVSGFAIPGSPSTWISVNPTSGTVNAGNSGQTTVYLDATDILAGTILEADVHFVSNPDVGQQNVHVTMTVGNLLNGHIVGNVTLGGSLPYNIGDVTEVLVQAGPYFSYPDASGDYDILAYPGTYDVEASVYGYSTQTVNSVTVAEGANVTVDFTMPCLYGMVSGTVSAANGGALISGATVKLVGTDFTTTSAADGTYDIVAEADNYNVKVTAPFYASQTASVVLSAEATTTQDFSLADLDGIIVVIDLDPTPNPEITDVIQGFFPGGLVEYTTSINGYVLDEQVQTVFLLLGIFSSNYTLLESDATVITTWLDTYGGNLYMEGGDTWAYDTPTSLHGYFNINGLADGSSDLTAVEGIDSFWAQFSWTYSGENNWIDHLEAIAPAINVCQNPTVGYFNTVAYDAGTYKTVGSSYEVTGLVDGTGSFDMGIASIMGFFGYPVFTYGDLEGYVYDGLSNPVAGATVSAGGLGSATSGSDGYYIINDLLVGTWDVTASKVNYQPDMATVIILENQLTTQDFILEGPGSLSGTVTEVGSGNPVDGATVDVGAGAYTTTTLANGTYSFAEILAGDWDVVCSKDGYNPEMANVNISQGNNTVQNFGLTAPQLVVTPLDVTHTLEPNAFGEETVSISNPGNGDVSWTASLNIIGDNGEDLFDVLLDVPVGIGGGEAGIETDGNYIYTSMWNGTGGFQRYQMDGTWVESITVAGSAGCRDIAYDGTYFYGGAASTTIFEMDLANAAMISTFTGPAACRAIAYNENEDVFYCNNWSDNITKFNKAGANLGSFPCGASAPSYYGFAYDGYSGGNPYLWGYSQTGATSNQLIQMQLPSGAETGLTFDVGSVTNVGAGIAGGLAIDDHIANGLWAFLGTSQNENIWALELTDAATWVSIDPNSGMLTGGTSEDMTVSFDATGLLPGIYEATINFSTTPNVGNPVVNVTLTVEGLIPAINLMATANCTTVDLEWEMPTGGTPDSWNVYRDGSVIGSATTMNYSDEMVDPEVEYAYSITAVYAGVESQPCPDVMITIATPGNLPPVSPTAVHVGAGDVQVSWQVPLACLAPDSYNVYRDGSMIGSSTTLGYLDPGLTSGFYEYYVVAVYYFGESGNSAPAYVLVGVGELSANQFQIYPNPAKDLLNIRSDYQISSVKLLNNVGQLILDKNVESNSFQINVSQYESGIYYIKLTTDEGTILRKVAVE